MDMRIARIEKLEQYQFLKPTKPVGKLVKPTEHRFATVNSFSFLPKTDRFSKPNWTGFAVKHEN
jgi:hypothetical protein